MQTWGGGVMRTTGDEKKSYMMRMFVVGDKLVLVSIYTHYAVLQGRGMEGEKLW